MLAGHRGRVGSASDCRAGGRRFKFRHPTSAETCMWGRRLAAMLALYTGKGVAPEVNLRERILHMPLPSANKAEPTLALKPRRCHQKSKAGVSVAPQMDMCPTKI